MKKWLRSITLIFSAGLLLQASASSGAAEVAKPLAVWFYADWCTTCKLLAPKYEPARAGFDDRIQFVKLDVTNTDTQTKARATAQALGIAPLYFSNHSTGWVALVDAKRVKVGELHYDLSVEEMRAALDKLAQGLPPT